MPKLVVDHVDGEIVRLDLLDAVAVESRPVLMGLDEEAHAALLEESEGGEVTESDFAALCGTFAYMTVVLTPFGVVYLEDSTLLLDLPSFVIDLWQTWRSGKYIVEHGAIVLNPAWNEPTIRLELTEIPVVEPSEPAEEWGLLL